MFLILDNPRRIINTDTIRSISMDGHSVIRIYRLNNSDSIDIRPNSGKADELEVIWNNLVGHLKAANLTGISHQNTGAHQI